MSIDYSKEVFNNGKINLKFNFSGIKKSKVSAKNLKLNVYAYDNEGRPIFTEKLDLKEIRDLYVYLGSISLIRKNNKYLSGKFIEIKEK